MNRPRLECDSAMVQSEAARVSARPLTLPSALRLTAVALPQRGEKDVDRREFFSFARAGIGSVALATLLMRDGRARAAGSRL